MRSVTVKTQTELDDAIADASVAKVVIDSPAGVWLYLSTYGSASVSAYDSASVSAYDSASVRAYDSASVSASGSASVRAYDSASVSAAKYAAVHLHSKQARISGGVLIDVTDIDLADCETWLNYHDLKVSRGRVVLYKAVDDKWTTSRGFVYEPGKTVTAPDFNERDECGGGLHFGPSPDHAFAYNDTATRFVAVSVSVADLVPITGNTAKAKARMCRVLHEVDIAGKKVTR